MSSAELAGGVLSLDAAEVDFLRLEGGLAIILPLSSTEV
jgi:hypothetical protein